MHVNIDYGEGQIDYAQQTSSRIRKQKCNAQTLSKTSGSIGGEHIKGETSLNKPIRLSFCSTLNGCFCALVCFVCFSLPYLFSLLHHIKVTVQ